MAIKIVTDSSITIDPELLKELDITVVPLSITIDGVTYMGGDLSLDDFMAKMKAAKNLPKTSQPSVGLFSETYEKLTAIGDEVISIHLTSGLSGTVEAARQGALISGREVTVLDSDFTDQALAFQVVEVAQMAQSGAGKEEILKRINEIRQKTELFIGISNLENLVKGGRISKTQGLIGNLLNVRVVMEFKNRSLENPIRGRGTKTFIKWLEEKVSAIRQSGQKIKEIGISHAEGLEMAERAKEMLQEFVEKPISIMQTGSIIATHTGAGAWAIMIRYE
ncbi:MAG: DegV family protein [Streptococcaceae bacterium]|nr:DegV family protein [Streptococcaceae bacterium]